MLTNHGSSAVDQIVEEGGGLSLIGHRQAKAQKSLAGEAVGSFLGRVRGGLDDLEGTLPTL